jgi:two-component system chemotaxis response regulator CheB
VAVDFTLPVGEMGERIASLAEETQQLVSVPEVAPFGMQLEAKVAVEGNALKRGVMRIGEISPNTCPECHGVLVKIREGSISRYRCHTGHAFSLQTLLVDVDEAIDDALWNAVRAIEERAMVLREIEEIARADANDADADRMAASAVDAERRAQIVRELVVHEGARGEKRR